MGESCALVGKPKAKGLEHAWTIEIEEVERWITHSLPKHALTHRANVRELPMMSIAACTVETRQVGKRRTVVAVIPIACD